MCDCSKFPDCVRDVVLLSDTRESSRNSIKTQICCWQATWCAGISNQAVKAFFLILFYFLTTYHYTRTVACSVLLWSAKGTWEKNWWAKKIFLASHDLRAWWSVVNVVCVVFFCIRQQSIVCVERYDRRVTQVVFFEV
jgi:hypothetical protein